MYSNHVIFDNMAEEEESLEIILSTFCAKRFFLNLKSSSYIVNKYVLKSSMVLA